MTDKKTVKISCDLLNEIDLWVNKRETYYKFSSASSFIHNAISEKLERLNGLKKNKTDKIEVVE